MNDSDNPNTRFRYEPGVGPVAERLVTHHPKQTIAVLQPRLEAAMHRRDWRAAVALVDAGVAELGAAHTAAGDDAERAHLVQVASAMDVAAGVAVASTMRARGMRWADVLDAIEQWQGATGAPERGR